MKDTWGYGEWTLFNCYSLTFPVVDIRRFIPLMFVQSLVHFLIADEIGLVIKLNEGGNAFTCVIAVKVKTRATEKQGEIDRERVTKTSGENRFATVNIEEFLPSTLSIWSAMNDYRAAAAFLRERQKLPRATLIFITHSRAA